MADQAPRPKTLRGVVRVMYEQSRTGVLAVTGPDGTVEIHLKDGKIVHAVPPPGSDWLLGHVLVESGTLPEKKLYKLLRKHRKTRRPLEILLIEQGTVTRDVLSKYMELQLRETILPLFLIPEIAWDFRDEPPQLSDFVRAVPIPFLLKEAEKRTKEWPVLHRAAVPPGAVFDKVDESIGKFLVGDEATGDGQSIQLGHGERIVYYYVNGRKTVQQIAYASCLGLFETLRAIHLLKRRGFIFLTDRAGKGDDRDDLTILPKLVGATFYIVLGILVAGLVLVRPAQFTDIVNTAIGREPLRSAEVIQSHDVRVYRAVDLFYAIYGRYPANFDELVAAKLLSPEEAKDRTDLLYDPRRDGYVLGPRAELLPPPTPPRPE